MISQATYRLSSQPPLQGIVVGSPGGPKALGPEDVKLALKLLPGTCCFCSPVFVGLDPPQNKVLFPIKTRSFGFQVHQPRGTHANIKIATQKKKMVGRLERQAFPFGKSAMIDFWGGNLLLKKQKKLGPFREDAIVLGGDSPQTTLTTSISTYTLLGLRSTIEEIPTKQPLGIPSSSSSRSHLAVGRWYFQVILEANFDNIYGTSSKSNLKKIHFYSTPSLTIRFQSPHFCSEQIGYVFFQSRIQYPSNMQNIQNMLTVHPRKGIRKMVVALVMGAAP